MVKTPNILIPALRQYQHNDCSGLIAGFEYEETIKIVSSLTEKLLKINNIELTDRGDGVKGHYCIRRRHSDGYAEHWNDKENKWCAYGTLYIGKDVAMKIALEMLDE